MKSFSLMHVRMPPFIYLLTFYCCFLRSNVSSANFGQYKVGPAQKQGISKFEGLTEKPKQKRAAPILCWDSDTETFRITYAIRCPGSVMAGCKFCGTTKMGDLRHVRAIKENNGFDLPLTIPTVDKPVDVNLPTNSVDIQQKSPTLKPRDFEHPIMIDAVQPVNVFVNRYSGYPGSGSVWGHDISNRRQLYNVWINHGYPLRMRPNTHENVKDKGYYIMPYFTDVPRPFSVSRYTMDDRGFMFKEHSRPFKVEIRPSASIENN